jgi:EpsI family protein
MIDRRTLTFAGLGLAAAATAEGLRPRRRLILLKNGTIEASLPKRVGPWEVDAGQNIVTPDLAGKLARALYKEIVAKTYYDTADGASMMLLAAYGDTQSDLLQVHRPEVCYAAVGFDIRSSTPKDLVLGPQAVLPVRQVVATAQNRTENIVYWTRMGETLPQSARDQQKARFLNAVHGYVADGILMRFSMIGDSDACFERLSAFIPAFLGQIPESQRPPLIGSALAVTMKA